MFKIKVAWSHTRSVFILVRWFLRENHHGRDIHALQIRRGIQNKDANDDALFALATRHKHGDHALHKLLLSDFLFTKIFWIIFLKENLWLKQDGLFINFTILFTKLKQNQDIRNKFQNQTKRLVIVWHMLCKVLHQIVHNPLMCASLSQHT